MREFNVTCDKTYTQDPGLQEVKRTGQGKRDGLRVGSIIYISLKLVLKFNVFHINTFSTGTPVASHKRTREAGSWY